MVCLVGAGIAFGEEQQSLMTGSLVPRLPSCGEQRSLGGAGVLLKQLEPGWVFRTDHLPSEPCLNSRQLAGSETQKRHSGLGDIPAGKTQGCPGPSLDSLSLSGPLVKKASDKNTTLTLCLPALSQQQLPKKPGPPHLGY